MAFLTSKLYCKSQNMHCFQIQTIFYLGQLPKSPFPAIDVVSKGIDFVFAFLPEILFFVFLCQHQQIKNKQIILP